MKEGTSGLVNLSLDAVAANLKLIWKNIRAYLGQYNAGTRKIYNIDQSDNIVTKTEFGKVKESCMFSVDCMCQEIDEFWCRDVQRMYTDFAALKTYLETGETPIAFRIKPFM